ncbi:MAG: cytochrome P450 [Lautropia sp.]
MAKYRISEAEDDVPDAALSGPTAATRPPDAHRGTPRTCGPDDRAAVAAAVAAMPLSSIDVSDAYLFRDDTIGLYFERLRREDPVHHCSESRFGPFWSITRFEDIRRVELDHEVFSSEASLGGIALFEAPPEENWPSFIAMDPPRHDAQRMTVAKIAAPPALARLEPLIRERAGRILDALPHGETFDWVARVSIELTTQMLATLFDFPFEQRHRLARWSEIATGDPRMKGIVTSWEMRRAELGECLAAFTDLWNARVNAPPRFDLISMMAHAPATRDLTPDAFLGNLILLIVGGNDTTRNSISGGLLALNRFPDEWRKLRRDPTLVASLVPEIVRWQTPLAHMRRTAREDAVVGGKTIRKGDKVAMWYLSANRDADAIDEPDRFIVDRPKPRNHLSFGFGIHHCMGNRIAELQLRVLWEEILARGLEIAIVGEPQRTLSNFVHGFTTMPVQIRAPAGGHAAPDAANRR